MFLSVLHKLHPAFSYLASDKTILAHHSTSKCCLWLKPFVPMECHKPSMRWNMDSCRFRQKIVVLMTFFKLKVIELGMKEDLMCFHSVPLAHWHTVLMLSRLYIRFLAAPLEHLGILKFLPLTIFPFSFSYSQKINTQTQHTITSIKKLVAGISSWNLCLTHKT